MSRGRTVNTKRLWLEVSNDKYRLPLFVCDTIDELAEHCNCSRDTVRSMISKARAGKIKFTRFEVIDYEHELYELEEWEKE